MLHPHDSDPACPPPVQQGAISITWTPSAEVLADGFTKALTVQGHKHFTEVIGLMDILQVPVMNS